MERCPVELWTKIACLACTDGGYTGCSLSLVSHAMHDVAEPVRYHSVSLDTVDKLLAFSARLTAMDRPPLIRHLFIAEMHVPRLRINSDDSWETFVKQRRQRAAEAKISIARIRNAVHTVVASAADTLYHLNVHSPPADITFPHLHDLTIAAIALTDPLATACDRFPSLRRLHVLDLSAGTSSEFCSGLADAAPNITHLRLSGVSQDTRISHFLRIILRMCPNSGSERDAAQSAGGHAFAQLGSQEDQEAAAVAARLPTLKCIIVQPTEIANGWCGTGGHLQSEMMVALGLLQLRTRFSVAESGQAAGPRFSLLPEQEYSAKQAREDWLDTVEGGSGPWQGKAVEYEEDAGPENVVWAA
ncbi:hypothetical protein PsYK624_145350 [Phanerochaete sordida]|uniref:F-box domain-containing protein n=1 Tax=Phanerochaete sordida TaxID=48140 RepID=A0A9P3LK95_9APHY|nr:hypothetical protein PsYK624_145350 [Phanerochaete sordida]